MILAIALLAAVIALLAVALVARERDLRSRDRQLQRVEAQHAAERSTLIDRIMYLSDRPWNEPPAYAQPESFAPARRTLETPDPGPEVVGSWYTPE